MSLAEKIVAYIKKLWKTETFDAGMPTFYKPAPRQTTKNETFASRNIAYARNATAG